MREFEVPATDRDRPPLSRRRRRFIDQALGGTVVEDEEEMWRMRRRCGGWGGNVEDEEEMWRMRRKCGGCGGNVEDEEQVVPGGTIREEESYLIKVVPGSTLREEEEVILDQRWLKRLYVCAPAPEENQGLWMVFIRKSPSRRQREFKPFASSDTRDMLLFPVDVPQGT